MLSFISAHDNRWVSAQVYLSMYVYVHAVFIAGGPNHGMTKHSPCHAHEVNVVVLLHVKNVAVLEGA
jgi:hypothetical protein